MKAPKDILETHHTLATPKLLDLAYISHVQKSNEKSATLSAVGAHVKIEMGP